jgi:hypothetical protein
MKKNLHIGKKITLILFAFFTIHASFAATRTATTTGLWSNTTTWGGTLPAAGDDVVIGNGITVTVGADATARTIVFASASGTITVNANVTLTVTQSITLQNAAGANRASTLAGAGTISCASLVVGGTNTSPSADATTTMTSTVSALNISGNFSVVSEDNAASENNAVFNHSSGTISVGGTLTLDADFGGTGTASTVTYNMNSGSQNGMLVLAGTTPFSTPSTGTVTTNFNGTANTVKYSAAGAQTVRNTTYFNLMLSGSGAKTIAGTVNGSLTIAETASTAGSVTYGANAILKYNGSSAQTTSNVEFPSTANVDVVVENASGVTLNGAKSLTGTITFTAGDLVTSTTNLLTILGSWDGTGSGASASSHVKGPLAKTGSNNFTFPVGNGTLYRPISIATLSASATVQATYFLANPRTTFGTAGTGSALTIQDVSACEYWDLNDNGAGINAIVGLQYGATSPCNSNGYITDPATLVVAHWNGASWENKGAAVGATITNMTASLSSTFSPFTIGTTNATRNPLPVSFTDVKAFEKGTAVQIDWTNATESDMSTYLIERSADGINFSVIGQTAPRSNQFDKVSYTYMDAAPLAGTNFYRIKAIELSGKNVYSKSLRVDIGRSPKGISLYPNPVRGSELNIGFTAQKGQYSLNVLNTAGQVVYRQPLNHAGGMVAQTVSLPASLKAGVYYVLISGDNYKETKMFVIQ